MKDQQNIKTFLSKIADKNYHQANEALKAVVEAKLKQRIATSLSSKK